MNNGIKKYGIIALMILISAFSVFLPLYIWPKEVANEFDAVIISEEQVYTDSIAVEISGHMNRRLFGGTRFTGKIKMDYSGLPDEFIEQNIQIKFDLAGIGVLKYLDESGERLQMVEKGFVAMPLDVSYIVISINDGESIKEHKVNGSIIIAGPAKTREQALDIANESFKKILNAPIN